MNAGHRNYLSVLSDAHTIGPSLGQLIGGMHPEGRVDDAIATGRRTAELHVPEHRDPDLGAGQLGNLFALPMPDAAVAHLAIHVRRGNGLAISRWHCFRIDD